MKNALYTVAAALTIFVCALLILITIGAMSALVAKGFVWFYNMFP